MEQDFGDLIKRAIDQDGRKGLYQEAKGGCPISNTKKALQEAKSGIRKSSSWLVHVERH